MAVDYTWATMLEAIRDVAQIPAAQTSGTSAKILAMANREQRGYLQSLLLSAKSNYLRTYVDVALTAGVLRYRIPARAAGSVLELVDLLDASDNPIAVFPIEQSQALERRLAGGPGAFSIEGNEVVFYEQPSLSTMRLHFNRRLSTLVVAADAGVITAIDTVTKVVTVYSAPSTFAAGSTAYDFVQAKPPFDAMGWDRYATTSSLDLTFAATLPSSLAVGDYVCIAGETPICQAPVELHDVLVQRVAFKWLEAKGDPKAAVAKSVLDEMSRTALELLTPRISDTPTALNNFNAPGWGRLRSWGRR